jgi:UDP-N-acetylglucosamine transferase subunit ALG13
MGLDPSTGLGVRPPVPTGAPGRKYLFAASTGGHLAQLVRFAATMDHDPDSVWVTFETPQSVSLLRGKRVVYVPYIASRDYRGVVSALRPIGRVLRDEHFDEVISTGAALALSAMTAAATTRVPRTYIESVSRVEGPSLTGRIIAALGLADLYTQHSSWAGPRWKPHESVLSLFKSTARTDPPAPDQPLKLFVTLGTIRPFRFDSLVDNLVASVPISPDSVWQVGVTTRTDLPGTVVSQVSGEDFLQHARAADVVVTHAGVGSILALLEQGIHPVVVPRRKERREHVDDHQLQISRLVDELGVATVLEADALSEAGLRAAAALAVRPA